MLSVEQHGVIRRTLGSLVIHIFSHHCSLPHTSGNSRVRRTPAFLSPPPAAALTPLCPAGRHGHHQWSHQHRLQSEPGAFLPWQPELLAYLSNTC